MSNQRQNHDEKISKDKLAVAERIRNSRKTFTRTYKGFESGFVRFFRLLSGWIDRILFNPKYGVLVALALSILVVSVINVDSASNDTSSFAKKMEVKVVVNGNADVYEYSNIPTTVEVNVFSKSNADILALDSSKNNYYVEADLRNFAEGSSNITLTAKNFPASVTTVVSPNVINVTIAKREIAKFSVTPEFINMNLLNDQYDVGTPIFETSEVNVRASKSTLESISSVKALIDVSNQSAEFKQQATLVAYDQSGNKMTNVLIIPETVNVTVPVTSTNKDVPITINVNGTIPNGKAIESITLDSNTVRIYGSQSTLDGITSIQKTIDATEITGDLSKIYLLDKPSGVRLMNPSKVNVTIKLGAETSKTIAAVPINYKNNTRGYKFTILNEADISTDVNVFGTATNIAAVSLESFQSLQYEVYFDMTNLEPGEHTVELKVKASDPRLRFELVKSSIKINITE